MRITPRPDALHGRPHGSADESLADLANSAWVLALMVLTVVDGIAGPSVS